MLLVQGKRYLFMGNRYAFSGTVSNVTPTHVQLDSDAQVHYDDVGDFGLWAVRQHKQGSAVPGQIVCLLGTDVTPIGQL